MTSPSDWKIPLSDLRYGEEEVRAVADTVRSGWLTQGPRVAAFEQALAGRLAQRPVVALSSCTAALHVALLAAGVGPGDEVIVPTLTFAATANVAHMVGARPIFADILSPLEPVLSPDDVAARLSPRTRAIIPMHYAGFACPMAELTALAGDRGLAIIEDAAHGFGGWDGEGRPLGTVGDYGAFSFFANKNLPIGEGGALVCPDDETADRARRLRCHGMTSGTWSRHVGGWREYDILEPGLNYRLSEIHAALGLAQLEKFDHLQTTRRGLWSAYVQALAQVEGVETLFPGPPERLEQSACHLFPVLVATPTIRDRLAEGLRQAGIQTSRHYRPLHRTAAYASGASPLPVAEDFAARQLTLPLHPRMTEMDVAVVADALARLL